jgi:predicted MPP superfamily phosphohydrolase
MYPSPFLSPPFLPLLVILGALTGHVLLWAELVNRVHSLAVRRSLLKSSTFLGALAATMIPLGYAARIARDGFEPFLPHFGWTLLQPGSLYLVVCWTVVAVTAVRLGRRCLLDRPPDVLRHYRTYLVDLAAPRGTPQTPDHEHHFLAHMPGNESLQLDVAERALELARMPADLEGLTVLHLSDLHFTGRISKAYFQEVVRLANELDPDLVAITGDLVDVDDCIDWIPDTLGRLNSRWGSYFVFGNHDLLVDSQRLRRVMIDSGLIDLGNRWLEVPVRGTSLLMIGNQLPWIRPAASLKDAPPPAPGGPLRIVLAHTPDQLSWARTQEADLLLAGHLHGGQIRLPLLGPLLAPSRAGVKYARSGVFHASPTVMHVTRGVSGMYPVRMNCPPEIVRLLLHAPRCV